VSNKNEEKLRITAVLTGEAVRIIKKVKKGRKGDAISYALKIAYLLGKLEPYLEEETGQRKETINLLPEVPVISEEESYRGKEEKEKGEVRGDKEKKTLKFLEELEEKFGLPI